MRSQTALVIPLVVSVLSCGQAEEPKTETGPAVESPQAEAEAEPVRSAPEPAPAPSPTAEELGIPAKVVPKEQPAIYEEGRDMSGPLDEALAMATAQNKRVLLMFGGNWCTWCHKLHMLMQRHPGIKARLDETYVRLMVDSNGNDALIEKLDVELKGVPFFAVLDAKGEVLARQETGSLEIGPRHDSDKVLGFLDQFVVAG